MKIHSIILFLLVSIAGFAQSGFPITKLNSDYYERLKRESMPLYSAGTSNSKTGTFTAGQAGLISQQVLPGCAWVIDNVALSSSQAVSVAYQERFSAALDPTPPSASISIPVRKVGLSAGYVEKLLFHTPHIITQGMICRVDAVTANSDATNELNMTILGYQISDDFNANAERIILLIGDSISSGTGVSTAEEIYAYKLRDHLRQATGKVWRIIRKTQFGITTSQMEVHRKSGTLDVEKADLIVYHLGVNDSGNPTNYPTNLTKFLDWKKVRYPNTCTIICKPIPLTGSSETAMISIRNNADIIVASYADPKTVTGNFGALWDGATQQGTYTIDGIHPNPVGHGLMEGQLWSTITANGNYIYNLVK